MSLFLDRQLYLDRFKRGEKARGERYDCTVLRWPGNGNRMIRNETTLASQVESLDTRQVNIIIAPLDSWHPDSLAGLETLAQRYNIPGAFLDERSQGVASSFSYYPESSTSFCTWVRFVLRNVEKSESKAPRDHAPTPNTTFRRLFTFLKTSLGRAPKEDAGLHELAVVHDRSEGGKELPRRWKQSSYFLRVDGAGTPRPMVTLVCFGPSVFLIETFEHLPERTNCSNIVSHPYILLDFVLHDLYMQLDTTLWELRDIFHIEKEHFGYLTASPTTPLAEINFSALHLLADYIIMLREASQGLLAILNAVVEHHASAPLLTVSSSDFLHKQTQSAFEYRRRLVQATGERAATFEKRISNLITLFFNHITQQDNSMLMRDSSSVKGIGIITLLCLPITTVATICGSQFFYDTENPDGTHSVMMDPSGWIMFAVSTVLSLALFSAWAYYTRRLEERFARGQRSNRDGKKLVFSP
ncbi:hypothetical protein MFIFM68171_06754 [Madurella fahalii]|uniref:Uncharacterized protein n=1 Tax=Madurella fahalii TaxID=1157608 RepID=A0ABQ0GFU4_9PEZI